MAASRGAPRLPLGALASCSLPRGRPRTRSTTSPSRLCVPLPSPVSLSAPHSRPLCLFLLLALSGLAAATLAAAQSCPSYDSTTVLTSLVDASSPLDLVHAFPGVPIVDNVPDAGACAKRAATFPCTDLGFSSAFFVFSATGFFWNGRQVTCLVGAFCGALKAGTTKVTYGYVAPRCPSPPPPGKPVACPAGPGSRSVPIDATYRRTVASYFTNEAPKILPAESEAECIAYATRASCQGFDAGFYIYTPDSAIRETDMVFGNCAFGPGCTSLIEGSVKASVGILPVPSCTAPPPSPPAPPSKDIPCPDPTSTAVRSVWLDVSDPYALAYGPIRTARFVNASSQQECAALAASYPCDVWLPSDTAFFVYAPTGIKSYDELGGPLLVTYTCALGAWCGNLQKGTTSAKIGYVSPRCPSPPPPGKPVVCPGGAGAQSVSIDGTRKTTVDGYFLGSEATYTFAADAAECKAKALEARCGGSAVSFYLFTPDSSFRETDILFGNCAFGSGCAGMIGGEDTAIVGNLDEPCPPPIEFIKCPEASSLKQQSQLLDLSNPFVVARGPWRIASLSNASSKDACAALASKYPCDEWFPAPTGFFVYAPKGVKTTPEGGVIAANCITGAYCGSLTKGTSPVVYGYVQPRCPAPPPPAAPVACAKGTEMLAISVDAAKFSTASTYFKGSVQVTYETSPRACRAAAQKADCGGFRARAFLYLNQTNFRDGDALYGNCMFGAQCTGMLAGRVAAVAGTAPRKCPAPSPPPSPPPPPYNPRLCNGGVPIKKRCACPPFSRCQQRTFCPSNKQWVCRCLGQFPKRVEAKNGTLLACK